MCDVAAPQCRAATLASKMAGGCAEFHGIQAEEVQLPKDHSLVIAYLQSLRNRKVEASRRSQAIRVMELDHNVTPCHVTRRNHYHETTQANHLEPELCFSQIEKPAVPHTIRLSVATPMLKNGAIVPRFKCC